MRPALLDRIAEETGGRRYTPDNVASLPDDVQFVGGGVTVVEERDLWDMPALLLLLGTLGPRRVGLPALPGAGVRVALRRGRVAGRRGDERRRRSRRTCWSWRGWAGDPTYREQFHDVGRGAGRGRRRRATTFHPERITYLGEDPDVAPELIADRSTRENIAAAIDALAERSASGDHVVIVLFGHGSDERRRRASTCLGATSRPRTTRSCSIASTAGASRSSTRRAPAGRSSRRCPPRTGS